MICAHVAVPTRGCCGWACRAALKADGRFSLSVKPDEFREVDLEAEQAFGLFDVFALRF